MIEKNWDTEEFWDKKRSVAVRVKVGVQTGDRQEHEREALQAYPTITLQKKRKFSVAKSKTGKIGKMYPTATLQKEQKW